MLVTAPAPAPAANAKPTQALASQEGAILFPEGQEEEEQVTLPPRTKHIAFTVPVTASAADGLR